MVEEGRMARVEGTCGAPAAKGEPRWGRVRRVLGDRPGGEGRAGAVADLLAIPPEPS